MPTHEQNGIQRRFVLSMIFTAVTLAAEVVGGLLSGSLALLSDAAHVFMDLFALGLSLLALRLALLPPDDRHSFGWHRLEVFAALINGVSLVIIAVGIWVEAYKRWNQPVAIHSLEMLVIAVIGLVVNVVVAFTLGGHDHHHEEAESQARKDLNLHSAFLHVVGDAISSVGVILAAVLIQFTGQLWIDPLVSILIGGIILVSSFRVLRSALHILVEGVPEGLSIHQISDSLVQIPEVVSVHDLHVWNICSNTVAMSAHIVLGEAFNNQQKVMSDVKKLLAEQYHIEQTTIQFDSGSYASGQGGCN